MNYIYSLGRYALRTGVKKLFGFSERPAAHLTMKLDSEKEKGVSAHSKLFYKIDENVR